MVARLFNPKNHCKIIRQRFFSISPDGAWELVLRWSLPIVTGGQRCNDPDVAGALFIQLI